MSDSLNNAQFVCCCPCFFTAMFCCEEDSSGRISCFACDLLASLAGICCEVRPVRKEYTEIPAGRKFPPEGGSDCRSGRAYC